MAVENQGSSAGTAIDDSTSSQTSTTTSSSSPAQPDPRFYVPTLLSIPQPISTLLETYSSIPPAAQIPHILRVRDTAYASHPYPCLGRFRFLDLDLSRHPLYTSTILPFLRREPDSFTPPHAPLFLDLGTCLGQDLRKLVHDGVDPARLRGSDIVPAFVDAGYALFGDEARLPRDRHFLVPGDVFDDGEGNALGRVEGLVDVCQVTAVFHLFGWDEQVRVAHRVLRLLRKDPAQKVLVVGGQAGKVEAGESIRNGNSKFRHNVESWREMWQGVFRSEEWVDKVASYQVESRLLDGVDAKSRDRKFGDAVGSESRVVGSYIEGFRWHVFWIWVEFQ